MVDLLFLGVIALSLSAAIYARWYGRRVKPIGDKYLGDQVSPIAKGLMGLRREKPDYSPAVGLIREQTVEALKKGGIPKESMGYVELLLSLCDGALKRKAVDGDAFEEIGRLYSYLGLGWRFEVR